MKECKYLIEDFGQLGWNLTHIMERYPNAHDGVTFKSQGYTVLLGAQNSTTTPQERIFVATKGGKLFFILAEGDTYWNLSKIPIKQVTFEELTRIIEDRIKRRHGLCFYHQDRFKEFLNELSAEQGTKDAVPERSNGVVT